MNGLALAMRYAPSEGEALPSPFERLTKAGAIHRRGQLAICAGASGGGKSAYATHLAVHGNIPTLYFSADTDRVTLGTRVAAGLLNRPTDRVEADLRAGDVPTWMAIEKLEHVWWCWDSMLSTRDIEDEVAAYGYAKGDYPHLIVVDNLINIDEYSGGGLEDKDGVMAGLQRMASITGAHVLVLHHVTGQYEDGLDLIPKSGLLDKVAKRPRLVLTTHRPSPDMFGVSIVKNSSGPAASDGTYNVVFGWMPSRSWFSS